MPQACLVRKYQTDNAKRISLQHVVINTWVKSLPLVESFSIILDWGVNGWQFQTRQLTPVKKVLKKEATLGLIFERIQI